MVEDGEPSPAERVLIAEACRLADRLDRLDAISNGKDRAWIQISDDLAALDSERVEIVVDKVLAEARQQQVTLKQIMTELRQGQTSVGPARKPTTPATGGGAGVADLTARIAGRRTNTAG